MVFIVNNLSFCNLIILSEYLVLFRCLFIVGDGYDLWDRTDDTWGTLKIAKPIWDYNPELIDTVGEIGEDDIIPIHDHLIYCCLSLAPQTHTQSA